MSADDASASPVASPVASPGAAPGASPVAYRGAVAPGLADRLLLLAVAGLAAGARWSGAVPLPALPRGPSALAGVGLLVGVLGGLLARMRDRRAGGGRVAGRGRVAAMALVGLLGGVFLGAVLAERSRAGLVLPATGEIRGAALVLRSDPVLGPFGVTADGSWRGKRLRVTDPGGSAGLARAVAGDRLTVDVRVRAPDGPVPGWRAARHLAGDATLRSIHDRRPATGLWGVANAVRRRYQRAFETIPGRLRPLALGFVLGDDRGQRPEIAADFRASGLGHLLVVSGQNVAFVLAAFRPAIDRLRLRHRVVGVAVVLLAFGTITRWEPSVVRAVAMAAAGAVARSAGRPQPALRILGLGVGVVLVIDPLLVWSLGFALSVGATLGLALLAEPIEAWLTGRGMRPWVAAPLAATVAAQALTVWLVLPISGSVPAASVPANLVAVPLAGPTMVLGIVLGGLGSVLRPGVADVVVQPLELLLGAVAAVARIGGGLPLGRWGPAALLVMTAGSALSAVAGSGSAGSGSAAAGSARSRRSWVRPSVRWGAGLLAGVAVLSAPATALSRPELLGRPLDGGGRLWAAPTRWPGRGAAVVVLEGRVDAARLLDALHRAGVGTVDAVVVARPGRSSLAGVAALRSRVGAAVVVGPSVLVDGPGGVALRDGDAVVVGPWRVRAHRDDGGRPVFNVEGLVEGPVEGPVGGGAGRGAGPGRGPAGVADGPQSGS